MASQVPVLLSHFPPTGHGKDLRSPPVSCSSSLLPLQRLDPCVIYICGSSLLPLRLAACFAPIFCLFQSGFLEDCPFPDWQSLSSAVPLHADLPELTAKFSTSLLTSCPSYPFYLLLMGRSIPVSSHLSRSVSFLIRPFLSSKT